MELTWQQIKKLKGVKLKEKSTGMIYEVNSVTPSFIRIGGGIKIITSVFYEIRQKDWDIVTN